MVRPDLAYPMVPDAEELDSSTSARPVQNGGMSLREVNDEGYRWPEAGPSSSGAIPVDSSVGDIKGKGKEPARSVTPFQAKLIAAMTGATTTALLMTPFDVLKTRMQTIKPHPRYSRNVHIPQPSAAECCQTTLIESGSLNPSRTLNTSNNPLTCFNASVGPSTGMPSGGTLALEHPASLSASTSATSMAATMRNSGPPPPPSGCLYPSKWAGIWGEPVIMETAMSGAAGRGGAATMALPESVASVGGFWHEIATVRSETGVRGLWKGVGTTIAMGLPNAAIYMLGYEKLLSHISPHFTGSTDPSRNTSSLNSTSRNTSISASLTPAPLIAGSLARTISATIISPIEMFRTRLQALPDLQRGHPTYASTAKEMAGLVRAEGPTMLWRGLGPTLWRDVPFSGIYWAGFEVLKSRFNATDLSPTTTSFLSGAISGTVSAVITQPFDVLKTRRQVFTPSPDCAPEALHHRASTLPLALHVIKTEGTGALFAGIVPRCGKVAPACGLMIACYEGVGRYLGGRDEPPPPAKLK